MNSDDTFRRLKRIPLKEMRQLYDDHISEYILGTFTGTSGPIFKELEYEKYGWTEAEFISAIMNNFTNGRIT